jgi:hypothetical protein
MAAPLSRSWRVLQGMSSPTSGSLVDRFGFSLGVSRHWLLPHSSDPLTGHDVFPVGAPLMHFASPSEFQVLRPACHLIRPRGGSSGPAGSSPEVLCPFSVQSTERLPFAALPQPLCSVLAVSHDLDGLLRSAPFQDLPGSRSWGLLPFRVSPAPHWAPSLPTAPFPPGIARSTPASAGRSRERGLRAA